MSSLEIIGEGWVLLSSGSIGRRIEIAAGVDGGTRNVITPDVNSKVIRRVKLVAFDASGIGAVPGLAFGDPPRGITDVEMVIPVFNSGDTSGMLDILVPPNVAVGVGHSGTTGQKMQLWGWIERWLTPAPITPS